MTVTPFPKKYTRIEAAAYLGISRATVDREMHAGRIEFYRAGRKRIYFLQQHLDRYIEGNSSTCGPSATSPDASAISGCRDVPIRRPGAGPGLTAPHGGDRRDARLSALQILRRPGGSSPIGTRGTSH